jgi:hypothetical protein
MGSTFVLGLIWISKRSRSRSKCSLSSYLWSSCNISIWVLSRISSISKNRGSGGSGLKTCLWYFIIISNSYVVKCLSRISRRYREISIRGSLSSCLCCSCIISVWVLSYISSTTRNRGWDSGSGLRSCMWCCISSISSIVVMGLSKISRGASYL